MDEVFTLPGQNTSDLRKLEHAATHFHKFETDCITNLSVCDSMTCATTASGRWVCGDAESIAVVLPIIVSALRI